MATSTEYLNYILDQLSDLDGITYRKMMGEYILYYYGKIAAYLCDDRLLVKPVPSAIALMPEVKYEPPYEGAKEMLLVENVDDKVFLPQLFTTMYPELPETKLKSRRKA